MERGEFIDLDSWARRAQFLFFKDYELPFFNVCSEVKIGPTLRLCRERGFSSSLACWFACQRTINAVESFRLRLRPGAEGDDMPRIWRHERIDIGTTILNDDGETFRFAYFPYADDFAEFSHGARESIARSRQGVMDERLDNDALIHGTTVPWLRFTSVTHPRRLSGEAARLDAIPKIVFGRYDPRGDETWLPVSVEVNHALMDGLHVGRFFEHLEQTLTQADETFA